MSDLNWRDLPALSALRAFDATARHDGFSGAARSLNVTPAAVAQQVRGLEAQLGVPLVRRSGRAVALTPQGERFARSLADGFGAIAAGVADLRVEEERRGLKVTTTTFIVDALIMPRMGEFWTQNPGAEVAFSPGSCGDDITPDLFGRDGFDLAIMGGSGDWPGVVTEPFLECPFMILGAPEICARAARDLGSVPWILPRGDEMEFVLVDLGVDLSRLRRVDVGNPRLELAAARAGHGMTVATEVVCRPDIRAGTLVPLPVEGMPTAHYYFATATGPRRPQLTRFIDWLRTLAADPA